MYVHIHIYIRMYVYMNVYIHTYIHTYVCMYTYVCVCNIHTTYIDINMNIYYVVPQQQQQILPLTAAVTVHKQCT